jgi:pimeloyl-ACP methyl ester carboxylesterase
MPRELLLDIDGFHFAAQEWGERGQLPVLALHGWLDNSASFYPLGQYLKNSHLVAVDMAGHGRSHHRQGSAPYHLWEDVADVFAIADYLGWQRFALLGHSRGAIVAMLAAGTFPDRITHVGLIEGLFPDPGTQLQPPQQLASAIKAMRTFGRKSPTVYPELAKAIAAREQGMFPLSPAAARLLTERGIRSVEHGYIWSTDRKLLAPAAIKFTREQVEAFIAAITAPIKLILGQEGIPRRFANFQREVAIFSQVDVVQLTGGHHLHMEQEVEAVACTLNNFFHSADR